MFAFCPESMLSSLAQTEKFENLWKSTSDNLQEKCGERTKSMCGCGATTCGGLGSDWKKSAPHFEFKNSSQILLAPIKHT